MTIPDYASFRALPRLKVMQQIGALPSVIGRPVSGWRIDPDPGAIPSTAQTCGRGTAGAISSPAPTSTRLVGVTFGSTSTTYFRLSGIIVDRLSHQGGLAGNTASTQTTNLPTAALTRYTSGEGVWIGLEIYTVVGGSQVVATVSYTNQAGTAGRTGTCQFGGSGYQAASQLMPVALQAGDTGARSVESVTLSATTGAAGNFGVTLFRPISFFSALHGAGATSVWSNSFGGCLALPPIDPDACLMPVFYALSTLNGMRGEFTFVEG